MTAMNNYILTQTKREIFEKLDYLHNPITSEYEIPRDVLNALMDAMFVSGEMSGVEAAHAGFNRILEETR